MTEIEPAGVWDTREPAWRRCRKAKARWLREHGFPSLMYRIEFLPTEPPTARIFRYALNEDGYRYLEGHSRQPHDHTACRVATKPPRIMRLWELPPRRLLRR